MPPPKFTSRNYFNAAQEHLGLARQALLQSQPQRFAAHYFAGLAVEAILRALSISESETFDGTHSIEHWARKLGILSLKSDEEYKIVRETLDEINMRWRANQRYYTQNMLHTYL